MDTNLMVIALAGNPNIGKNFIYYGLTGRKPHTGNWLGNTAASAQGRFEYQDQEYLLVDLTGAGSWAGFSEDEKIAKNFIGSGEADIVVVVYDAAALERGLDLLSQILQLDFVKDGGTPVILCVNLCDEAGKKGILIDFELLSDVLQIPVISCCSRCNSELEQVKKTIHDTYGNVLNYSCLDFSPKKLAKEVIQYTNKDYRKRQELLNRILTGPVMGGIVMVLLLIGFLCLTMTGANYPSKLLWNGLFWLESELAWVVSVLLLPMVIFIPLFSLLEDLGYLPKIAFTMDHRTIYCKGRFPAIFTLITYFLIIGIHRTWLNSLGSALLLTAAILLSILGSMGISRLLSHPRLRGVPSCFSFVFPADCRPQFGKVILRSMGNRTLSVLIRAIGVGVATGLVIWILANIYISGQSLLLYITVFFDPLGQLMGLDGVILVAFILVGSSSEIVLPIIFMTYLQTGYAVEMSHHLASSQLLLSKGWTWGTALCVLIFCLFHWPWPCFTTCLDIKKRTVSWWGTGVAVVLPTLLGIILCILISSLAGFNS